MNVKSFLDHWGLSENPFLAEEARQDHVLSRLSTSFTHPDFAKILGDLDHPSSSVVFGEKGIGKTAIRMQIGVNIREHNAANPTSQVLAIGYDDLNPVLDRLARHVKRDTSLDMLKQMRLVDHIDALLGVAVTDLVTAILNKGVGDRVDLSHKPKWSFGSIPKMKVSERRDWAVLQALYDTSNEAAARGREFRRKVRYNTPVLGTGALGILSLLFWILAVVGGYAVATRFGTDTLLAQIGFYGVVTGSCLLGLVSGAKYIAQIFRRNRLVRKLSRELRVLDRSPGALMATLDGLSEAVLGAADLPIDDLDESRYEMLERLVRAIKPFGFQHVLVLIDRIDEPTPISGDVASMEAVVWPLLNNKFLQQEKIAFKLMLPIELSHVLRRQSSEFFQQARLDKQNLIERLSWTGPLLYDLCTARMNACRTDDSGEPMSLMQFFDDTVERQDLIDALDQMHQPRDAFKMMYQVIQEHCAVTSEEAANWNIPRLTLDQVRRAHVERVDALHRGLGPA